MMQNKAIEIKIPEPCHENWSTMTPVEKGNFCLSCNKVVVDFTKKTDKELTQFFKESNGNLCGKFKPTQLNRAIPLTQRLNPRMGRAMSFLFSGLLLTTSALAQNRIQPTIEQTPREIVNGKILLTVEEENTSSPTERTIKGNVSDENGEILIGANVIFLAQGEMIGGTITDFDGNFDFEIPNDCTATSFDIEVSYVGYENIYMNEVLAGQNLDVKVIMVEPYGYELMGVVVQHYEVEETVWTKSKSLWNRIKYSNPIQNWKANRAARPAAGRKESKQSKKATRKAANDKSQKEQTRLIETGKPIVQTLENASFVVNRISPNPFTSFINIDLETQDDGEIVISLFSEIGERVLMKTIEATKGQDNITLDLNQTNLVSGTYILNLYHENGFQKSEILVLEK